MTSCMFVTFVVHEVDRHLGAPVLGDDPADGAALLEEPALLDLLALERLGVETGLLQLRVKVAPQLAVALGQGVEGVVHRVVVGARKLARGRAVLEDLAAHVARRAEGRAACDAVALAEVEREVGRVLLVPRVEVQVVRDEELAGADRDHAGLGEERRGPEVRLPLGLAELVRQGLVLAPAHVGERAPLGAAGGLVVEVDGDAQLVPDALAELGGEAGRSPPWSRRRRARRDRRRWRRDARAPPGARACR